MRDNQPAIGTIAEFFMRRHKKPYRPSWSIWAGWHYTTIIVTLTNGKSKHFNRIITTPTITNAQYTFL